MEYRIHPKTGQKISIIGFGTGPLCDAKEEDAVKAIVEKIKVLENENQHLNTVLNKFTEFNKAKKSAQDLHHEQQTITAKFEEFKPKERKIYKAKKANLIKNGGVVHAEQFR